MAISATEQRSEKAAYWPGHTATWRRSGLSQGLTPATWPFPEFPELLAGANEPKRQGFRALRHLRPRAAVGPGYHSAIGTNLRACG